MGAYFLVTGSRHSFISCLAGTDCPSLDPHPFTFFRRVWFVGSLLFFLLFGLFFSSFSWNSLLLYVNVYSVMGFCLQNGGDHCKLLWIPYFGILARDNKRKKKKYRKVFTYAWASNKQSLKWTWNKFYAYLKEETKF